jgi:hypothetical protein
MRLRVAQRKISGSSEEAQSISEEAHNISEKAREAQEILRKFKAAPETRGATTFREREP